MIPCQKRFPSPLSSPYYDQHIVITTLHSQCCSLLSNVGFGFLTMSILSTYDELHTLHKAKDCRLEIVVESLVFSTNIYRYIYIHIHTIFHI